MELLSVKSGMFDRRKKEIESYDKMVQKSHEYLHCEANISQNADDIMTGWVEYPKNCNELFLNNIIEVAKKVQKDSTVLVIIGIGGSFLGARGCIDILKDSVGDDGINVLYAGWNLSASYHAQLLAQLENEEVSLCVISKSGNTMETSIAFALLKEYMVQRYGHNFNHRIYAITDDTKGYLLEEAKEEGYYIFPIDQNIGGRYSVLTAVGLFPMAVAGVDIKRLMGGALKAYEDCSSDNIKENICYQYAVLRNSLFQDDNKTVEIFSTMEPHMYGFSEWLKQLFGESEGKNARGIFPACIRYSTDLHSMGQFLQEGNPLFFESILTTEKSLVDLGTSFNGKTFHELNKIVCDAVTIVREENNTPMIHFTMYELNEDVVGYAIYFFEKACAMCCLIQGINPFDQPGVEAYKSEILHILKGNNKNEL